MLVSIKKIKGLGIFSDFSASTELQNLKRYNVFYGDNGPGKTTLSVEYPVERLWKDGAVEGRVATLRGIDGGKRYEVRLRFADIWARRSGQWQVVFTQVALASLTK